MLMICNTWYCFLRLHQILCERLTRMYECAQKLVAEETQNKSERKESTAIALRLKPKSEFSSLIHCFAPIRSEWVNAAQAFSLCQSVQD